MHIRIYITIEYTISNGLSIVATSQYYKQFFHPICTLSAERKKMWLKYALCSIFNLKTYVRPPAGQYLYGALLALHYPTKPKISTNMRTT